uniref:C2 domain-containing protein n=1 Tax=Fibrocapsa japonica TaxID=94617 RepID=A0A7S2UXI7_9STRA
MMAEDNPASIESLPRYYVDIIEAKEIIKIDLIGHCSPYFVIKYGDQQQQTTIKENIDQGTWNERYTFYVRDKSVRFIEIFAFSKNMVNSEIFGKVTIDLTHVPLAGWFEMYNTRKPDKPKGANLKLEITYENPNAPSHPFAKKAHGCFAGFWEVFLRLWRHPDEVKAESGR